MQKLFLISAALDEELAPILQVAKVTNKSISNVSYWEGHLFGKGVVLYKTLVARTAASYATGVIINEFQKNHKNLELVLVNVGSSGACLREQKVYDTVVAKKLFYVEPDIPGYKRGQVAQAPWCFKAHGPYLDILKRRFKDRKNLSFGNFLCTESFINEVDQHNKVMSFFEDIKSIDMESTAIAHAGYLSKVPFVGIRTISDSVFNSQKPNAQFERHIEKVGYKYLEVIRVLFTSLPN